MVRNDEIIAQHCMDNRLPSKCAYEVQQTTVLLPESTMLSNSISHVQSLYFCSKFYW